MTCTLCMAQLRLAGRSTRDGSAGMVSCDLRDVRSALGRRSMISSVWPVESPMRCRRSTLESSAHGAWVRSERARRRLYVDGDQPVLRALVGVRATVHGIVESNGLGSSIARRRVTAHVDGNHMMLGQTTSETEPDYGWSGDCRSRLLLPRQRSRLVAVAKGNAYTAPSRPLKKGRRFTISLLHIGRFALR
jgi:hypothetical protein